MREENMTKENNMAVLADGEAVITEEMAKSFEDFMKAEVKISETEDATVITAPNKAGSSKNKKSSLGGVTDTDVIGNADSQKSAKPTAKAVSKKATVAIYSERNARWSDVGEIHRGYNFVTREQAEKWLTRKHVREATPEEVASEYGA
jgi:hypothetical protein